MVARRWIGAAMLAVGACSIDTAASEGSNDATAVEDSDDGIEPDTDTPTTDPSATVDSSDAQESGDGPLVEPCPETHACVAPVPEGWRGPVARVGDDDACPDAYPELDLEAFTRLVTAATDCVCTCDTSALCGALLGSDLETACSFPSPIVDTTAFAEPDVCSAIPTIDGGGFHLAFEPTLAGQCGPVATVIVPDPVLADRVLVCGAPSVAGDCPDDRICAPRLPDPQVAPCIVRAGDHECPPEYPDAHRASTSVLDDRGCSPCECTAPDGPASCATTVRLSSVDDCTDEVVPDTDVGAFTCVPSEGVMLSFLRFTPVEALVGGCMPSGGLPIGSVEPAGPVTICCAG